MAGLISDIGSVCNTFSSIQSFGKDILSNVGKSLSITDRQTYKTDDIATPSYASDTNGADLRGIKQVFRDKIKNFKYNVDYKCFNDDYYFRTDEGKDYRNSIQDIIIYEFQPYKQTQFGTLVKKLNEQFSTEARKRSFIS